MGAQETVGKLIDVSEKRDAVHVAVEPCVAEHDLSPGDHVGLLTWGWGHTMNTVGIVDPFLLEPVKAKQRFWLFIYPRQVTSLRHVWTHPYFEEEVSNQVATAHSAKASAKSYMEDVAKTLCRSYDEVMEHAQEWLDRGERWVGGDSFEGEFVDDHFWDHYEVLTGKPVPVEKRENFFSCSC